MATVIRAVTRTVTVNAAFLQEIKEVHDELWRIQEQLRDMCSRPMSVRDDATGFIELLGRFRDELAMQFSLEEAYGYFENPVDVAPWLDERAHELRSEHESLYREIVALVERAEDCLFHARRTELMIKVPLAFGVFDDQLTEHEHRETELVLAAFQDDIGVGD